MVTATEAPPQKATVSWIAKGLQRLNLQDLKQATIYGKAHQNAQPTWQQIIKFSPPAASKAALNSQTNSANHNPEAAERNSVEKVAQNSHVVAESEVSIPSDTSQPLPTTSPDKSSLDLSGYCFTRNKSLLKGDLTYPAESVAQLVLSFAALKDEQKQQALPHIEQFLRKPLPLEDEISDEAKEWLKKIEALEGPQIRKASIWLSRYCLNPAKTVAQLDKSAIAKEEEPEPEVVETPDVVEVDASTTNAPFPSTHNHPKASKGTANRAPRSSKTHKTQLNKSSLLSTPNGQPAWLIPAGWSICLAIMITLGVISASNATYTFPICHQSTADADACGLAVQIVGDEYYMADVVAELADAPTMTPESKSTGIGRLSYQRSRP